MSDDRQFYALYVTRFAGGFGFTTMVALLGKFINLFEPSPLFVGLFTTGLTLAQTAAVIPLAYAGDSYDKRAVLLGSLGLGVVAYALFGVVGSSASFVAARAVQGVAVTGAGMMSLALIGQLSPPDERAGHIGTANAFRLSAGVAGTLVAAALYQFIGREVMAGVLAAVVAVAFVLVWLFLEPDDSGGRDAGFADLAFNRRIAALTGFRAQYAVAVTLVRTWVPIYAGVSAARGGLAMGAVAASVVVVAERFANMLAQPRMGRLSDRHGRALFVLLGGSGYGLVALLVPLAPAAGGLFGVLVAVPGLGTFPASFLPLVSLNAALGLADSLREPASMALFADEGADEGGIASSFGVRELVWRPGSVAAPMLGGFLMADVGMSSVFHAGGIAAFSGVAVFYGALRYAHGPQAVATW
ncbi:MAG: MFS transporter [Halobacteriales archaeon]